MSRSKRLRNVALLGGAALLASKMLGGKKGEAAARTESKEDRERDARQEALAGPLRSLAGLPSDTKSDKKDSEKSKPAKRETTPSTPAPGISVDEGRTAIGLPREARGRTANVLEGVTASGMPREARGIGVAEGMTASGMPREARGVPRGDVPGSQVFAQINADRSARQRRALEEERYMSGNKKSGGAVKMRAGGKVSSASKRADGIAIKGKTRCKIV